jgi:hypothetical protein
MVVIDAVPDFLTRGLNLEIDFNFYLITGTFGNVHGLMPHIVDDWMLPFVNSQALNTSSSCSSFFS